MRDPTSAYSFLNFLHTQGRLAQYINREEKVPSRREWSAYLAWAAQRMDSYVQYNRVVTDIEPVERHGKVAFLKVLAKNLATGEQETVLARNVTTAVGGSANVPAVFREMYQWPPKNPDEISRVVHASTFLPQMERLDKVLQRIQLDERKEPLRLAVVGGGQSSAEMMCYLRDRFPEPQTLASWWSYRARDWDAADKGRRLDHIWATPDIAGAGHDSRILRPVRGWEQPSDHVPVLAKFDL